MSRCWLGPLLVTVVAVPFSLAIVTLLHSGKAPIQAAGLIVGFLLFVIILLMGLLRPQDHETNGTGQGLAGWVAASESPPAYDVVIKSPPPYFNYPGGGSGMPHPAPSTMYYCYCGSGNATTAATACKPCNSLPQPPAAAAAAPYIIHVTQNASKPPHGGHHPALTDPWLPSYNDAVKVVRLNSGNEITHL